ncbi:hypothetical protein B0T16DRAFT_200677 [Cercophora newfieldiana]|uniref:Carrier domain-containing protein n=1 Tax=Cercophora newfieldiana TaxID=92897 RepID=A0AA40CJF0_9PEZI|nr:hypothetical protein B0T16DRAFT_200677 [Cercophora newfieldiana]
MSAMAVPELDSDGNTTPLSVLNYPASRLPGPGLLHQLVREHPKNGVAPAIDFLGADGTRSSFSYSEFHAAANALASRISVLIGAPAPFVVPVLVPQSPPLYIAQLAILRSGGAFCPLNLDIPIERARLILEEVNAKVVITTKELVSKLPAKDGRAFLFVDDSADSGATRVDDSEVSHRVPKPTDLAYVMYTSGSTGTPKGVGISHDAATQSLLGHDRHIPDFSRFLQFAAPTFDVSVFEIFFPFFRGQTLVSCDRSSMLNDLPAVLRTMEVDACELTPSVAGSLLRTRDNAPGLRLLLTIGEMLTEPVIKEFGGGEGKESMLWGMYGPTEAAIHCTVQPAFRYDSLVGDIGVPLDTVSAFILSVPGEDQPRHSEFRVLPRGEAGELAVGGHQTAEEYINRPEQTAAAFIDTPFGRLYRTGDKAVIHPNGTLECLGRIGFGQVKLRGQRIELGEIEHAALRTPGSHGAVAAIIKNVLVLFCAVDVVEGMSDKIDETCRRWLPGFMVPGDIVVTREFPRLPSGKVDRKSLAANYSALEALEAVSYADDLERKLCEFGNQVLGMEVRPSSILSKVGVDSLVAIKFASALQEAGVRVGAVDILLSRTISDLRRRVLERQGEGEKQPPETAIPANVEEQTITVRYVGLDNEQMAEIEAIIPCTPLQASMLAETMADSQAYCNWIKLNFPMQHSEELVRSWIFQLAKANETLRTGFVHHQSRFLQVIFKQLDESSVVMVDTPSTEFRLEQDQDFLRPFRVEISSLPGSNHREVVFQIHHAVYDGWSMDLIVSDLQILTRGGQLGARPQFRQVAEYYQSPTYERDCDAARTFWAEKLVGFQPPTLPHVQSEIPRNNTVVSVSTPLKLRPDAARESLQKMDCGVQTLFQAALAWLWGSFLGLDDVVLGTVTSGRTLALSGVENVIGPCIAPVPVRTNLSQVRTIGDLLSSVHSSNREALPHSILPLGEIKRLAGIRSGQPLYDALFVYQESLLSGERATNDIKEVAHQDFLETKLLVEIEPVADGFACRLTSRTDVFTEDQLEMMGKSIHTLVRHMLEHADSEMATLRSAFSSDLLSVFNPTPKTLTSVPDLAYCVEMVAIEHPDKYAVCFAESISDGTVASTTITFDRLNKLANRIAWLLKESDVREGDTVAIVMEKSVLLYAGILAILKAGAAYLPLLPSTPLARVDTIFQQADVKICISDTATRSQLSEQITCTIVDLETATLQDYPFSNPTTTLDPDRPAYIIFTSGSTGVPKGVCVTQLNIVSNLDVLSRIYPVSPTSRLLQSCSQAFDVSVFEIFFAWTTGVCLCSGTNDTLFEDLERAIRMLGVTHLSMTPTVAGLVDPVKVPGVEFLVTAGEAMTEGVAASWGSKLFQGYGPSETTNICSVKRMTDGPGQVIRHLGWAFENTSTVLLYPNSEEAVPIGCLGELCFGGDQVAKGYLKLPELTAQKFIQHPVYGRLYRSGDLGRMLPDGSIVIDGRMDDQVKIRGQRVELDEVTKTIARAPGVVDCATILLKRDETSSERIVTFVVPHLAEGARFRVLDPGGELGGVIQETFRTALSQLPGYMIPSFLVPISVLPTTPSGKLDRPRLVTALRDLAPEALGLVSPGTRTDEDDGEWSDIERQIANTVAAAFSTDPKDVQRWTPLTTFGLDSISAIEVSRRLSDIFGKRVAISQILSNASVARLAQVLESLPGTSVAKHAQLLPDELVKIVSSTFSEHGKTISDILPCTPLQEAMLAVSTDTGRYLNQMLFKVHGDTEKLKAAWMTVCQRHGILRTCFVSTPDTQRPIVQVILEDWEPPWQEEDASEDSVEAYISSHIASVPPAVDSLQPTVSFCTIRDGDVTHLSFVCHHALYDGVAVERLLWEVEQALAGQHLGPPPNYREFLQESLQLPGSTNRFWGQHLEGLQPQLLTKFNIADPEPSGFVVSRQAGTSLSGITEKTRSLGVSILSLSQTTWATVLGCLFRTTDVCFGNVVSGRSLPLSGVDRLVAPCFNTIPVRMKLSDKQQSLELMKRYQALNPELLAHQFTPLRRIQSVILKGEGRRLFDTLLLLQQPTRKLDARIWSLERDDGEMDIPLVCELLPDTHVDSLTVKLHIEANRLHKQTAELILDLFFYIMDRALQFPASTLPTSDTIPDALKAGITELQLQKDAEAPEADSQETTSEVWTSTENVIRAVISTLSSASIDKIRRRTTIYQLGLDSISAVQVASALRKRGLDVTASNVIDNPTCQKLGGFLDSRAQSESQPNGHEVSVNGSRHDPKGFDIDDFRAKVLPQIERHGVATETLEAILPCTPLQSGMMAQFVKSEGQDYFNFLEFDVENGISAAALAEAWELLREVHSILRTGIVSTEHPDFPFAMIQRVPQQLRSAVDLLSRNNIDDFDPDEWRRHAAGEALRNSHECLWRVAIIDGPEHFKMHLAIHHALYDAHSLQTILMDLSTALQRGAISPSIATETTVIDILDQISAAKEASSSLWTEKAERFVINGFPVMTPLRETTRRILVHSATSTASLSALETSVSQSGYTIQSVLQAAWARILSSYLGETSVVFGVVLSGRTTDATQSALFPCITTLPVVSSNRGSNRTLLDEMMAYNTELYKQQHQPLTQIQQWLGRGNSRLFDTLLVYQKFNIDTPERRPWKIVTDQATVDYPISIEVEPGKDGSLRYQITYFSDILPTEQADVLLRQFDAVVQHLASDPDGNDGDLVGSAPHVFSVLPAAQPVLPSPVQTLHQFVKTQSLATPSATALYFVDAFDGEIPSAREWTYEELNANGNRVASGILPHVKVGDIVAIDFDKCPEAFFSILGVLKAGAAFVALDPGAPAARKQFILEDSGASVLLTSKTELEYVVSLPVIKVDREWLDAQSSGAPKTDREIKPDDVCYCLYTSGTTGTPKGCEITHDNAVQCMLAFQEIFKGHWEKTSRWLQFASLHFDVSVLEQYWSWSVGITLVAAPRDLILEDLAGTISRLEITHIDLTPSLARLLRPEDVPSLCRGVFITGGESLKQEILDAWGSKAVIYNFYGPTEATIGVTVFPRVPENGRSSNIGQQFINVGSYVLKPGTDTPVLKGAVGELCVSGRLVGKGYLNRQELTVERFPTLESFGERVYRTGDLVRVLHDGCFDFLGRADDQVKLRGQRLEIGEINHAIKTGVSELKDVATLVVRNEQKQKDFLVSFIVTEQRKLGSGESLEIVHTRDASELARRVRHACRSRLPGYMVPTYIFQLPFIPLSPNNKAEVKELKSLFNNLSSDELVSSSSTAEGSPTQLSQTGRKIALVLAALNSVDVDKITASSSIFELGVDSISVLRFSRELKRAGLEANPALILKYPVIEDLVHVVEAPASSSGKASVAAARQLVEACAHRHRAHVCRELRVRPDQIEYIAPCSPLQQGMISRSAVDGAYFNTFKFRLYEAVSTGRLRDAWMKVAESAAILRTVFLSTTDGCVQVALRDVDLRWEDVVVPAEQQEEFLETRRQAWIGQNGESVAQPWEILVVNDQSDRFLVLNIFHGLYDANSFQLMVEQLAHEYSTLSSLTNGTSHDADPPSLLDALCHGPLQGFTSSKAFWMDHLSEATPVQKKPPHGPSASTCERSISFEALERLRSSLAVTQQALVQAAWIWALAKRFGASPTIGIIVSGRTIDLDGADKVIGPLFNTLPFHAEVVAQPELNWANLIQQCHQFNTAVIGFQHVPLRDVQKWCSGGQPLFDTLFSFQRDDGGVAGSELWTGVSSDVNADYPLALEATLTSAGELKLLLVAQGEGQDLAALMDDLEVALMAMAKNSSNSVWPTSHRVNGVKGQAAIVNGNGTLVPSPTQNGSHFVWTEDAVTIRQEIALLADMSADSVTETTSIFELGLDSIDAIKLSARLKVQGVNIKTSQIMASQTVSKMLELTQTQLPNGHSTSNAHLTKEDALRKHIQRLQNQLDGVEAVFPTTPLQDSMVAEMIHSDFQLYFNHDILEIAPQVDIEKLKQAWGAVVAASPILRTGFIFVDDPELDHAYCQVVYKEPHHYLAEVELDSTTDLAKVTDAALHRARKSGGRYDLVQLVFAKAAGKRFLVLSIAHALYDGWSLDLLHQDVRTAYAGKFSTRPLYDAYLDEILHSGSSGSEFWASFLEGVSPIIIPEKNIRSKHSIYRAEEVSPVPVENVTSFCKAQSITAQALGQACWAAVLASRTGALDVTFGVVLSGRESDVAEKLMFPTMNTVAVRSVLHGDIGSWLRYIQDNAVNIAVFQHTPLRKVQKLAKSGPLFNTLFIQQRRAEVKDSVEELMTSVQGSSSVEFPVCVEMEMRGDALVWKTACDGDYLSEDDTSLLLRDLDAVLRHILQHPGSDVLSFTDTGTSMCGLAASSNKARSAEKPTVNGSGNGSDASPSPTEETIRKILAEVSGAPATSILPTHSIYHLGLDSISAIKVVSLLRKQGVPIALRDMLRAKSVSEMGHLATTEQSKKTRDGDLDHGEVIAGVLQEIGAVSILQQFGLGVSDVEEIMPATPMQVHMLSVWQNTEGNVFHPTFNFRLGGGLDQAVVLSAWQTLVAEMPLLRTTFVSTGSKDVPFLQVVIKGSPKKLYAAIKVKEGNNGETLVQLRIHHALYDAVSLPEILDRLSELSVSAQAKVSHIKTTAWRAHVASLFGKDMSEARKQFWTSYLYGVDPTPPSLTATEPLDGRSSLLVSPAINNINSIRELCSNKGITIQSLFFASYAAFLASFSTGPKDVVLGVYLANRSDSEMPFYPTLRLVPLRVHIGQGVDLTVVAQKIQQDLLAISAQPNIDVGLWEILEWTGIKIDTFVNFLSVPEKSERVERGIDGENLDSASGAGRKAIFQGIAPEAAPDGEYNEWEAPPEIQGNVVRDAYPVSEPPCWRNRDINGCRMLST